MKRYLLHRLVSLVPVWLCLALLAFGLASFTPGDPAFIILQRQTGEPPTDQAVQALRRELGLDDPFLLRFGRWLTRAVQGDLGRSFRTGEPVLTALADRFLNTLAIALAGMGLAVTISLPLGVLAAVRRDSGFDHLSRLGALLGASLPGFWLGYLLILLFAVALHLLPVAGLGSFQHLILPSITLALGAVATLSRLTRGSLLEVLDEDYIRTARAKGLPEKWVILRHGLRNALIPVVTAVGLRFGHLLGGAVIVETVFAWPGIGKFVVDSIYDRDYPAIQGFVVFIGTVFVLLNLLVDLAYVWLDPRIRLEGRGGHGGV